MYWLWTVDESADVWMPIRNNSPVDYCALSARARLLVTACADRFVYVWEVPGGALVERYGTRRLFSHLIPPSPRRETAGGDHLDEYFPGEPVYSVDVLGMSPDGSHAIFSARGSDSSGVGRGTPREQVSSRVDSVDVVCLLVLNLETREVQSLSTNEIEPVSAFAMDSEVRRLLWAKADHAIEVWALREASRVTTLRGHTGKVNALAFSNDGRHAISCARDRTLRVWDLLTGEQLAVYTADSALRSLAISSQAVIAVGDVAGRVHFLRFEEGRPR